MYSKYNKTTKIHSRRNTYELWSIKYIKSPMMDDDEDGWWWMQDAWWIKDAWWIESRMMALGIEAENFVQKKKL